MLLHKSSGQSAKCSFSLNIVESLFTNRLLLPKEFLYKSHTSLIGAEGCSTPAGLAGQVRPHRSVATRRLTARPAESEHPGAEINLSYSINFYKKNFYKKLINKQITLLCEGLCYMRTPEIFNLFC